MSRTLRSACRNKHEENWNGFYDDFVKYHKTSKAALRHEFVRPDNYYNDCEEHTHNRDNHYWALLHGICSINYAIDVYEREDLEELREELTTEFDRLYSLIVPTEVMGNDFSCNNDI